MARGWLSSFLAGTPDTPATTSRCSRSRTALDLSATPLASTAAVTPDPVAAVAAAVAAGRAAHAAATAVRTALTQLGGEQTASAQQAAMPPQQDPFDNVEWRQRHNYSLDRGTKFGVIYKSPTILHTDLFDIEEFGCHESRGFKGLGSLRFMKRLKGNYGKQWWHHPEFTFGSVLGRIGVTLQDLTDGTIKWDAVYELPEGSNFLMRDDKPIGGSHPFFEPDWCPAPAGAMAHRYLLTVKNLGELPEPALETIGNIMFMQYNPTQLEHTYAYENDAPPEPSGED